MNKKNSVDNTHRVMHFVLFVICFVTKRPNGKRIDRNLKHVPVVLHVLVNFYREHKNTTAFYEIISKLNLFQITFYIMCLQTVLCFCYNRYTPSIT